MLQEFLHFIEDHHLLHKQNKVLVAVSGGIDSMVLTHLFQRSPYRFAIAHCNFELRGKESDADEEFVREYALKNDIPFFQESFNTRRYAREKRYSVQMAARDLRLSWFESIRKSHGFHRVALAHNKNDNIETFLINLTRGTGIQGLTGIRVQFGHLIRPLLFSTRSRIEEYREEHSIPFREDSSNAETKYIRNKIRHTILPRFREINPAIEEVISRSLEHLKEVESVYNQSIDEAYRKLVSREGSVIRIRLKKLHQTEARNSILYEILKNYGINRPQLSEVIALLDSIPGKQVLSATHRIIRDRDYLLVTPIQTEPDEDVFITEAPVNIDHPVKMNIRQFSAGKALAIPHQKNIATLDADLVEYPLRLRKWKPGDSFMPFGMEHMKKISDFFIDLKLSVPEKEQAWILEDAFHRILWVVGYRIDHRFQVQPESTTNLLQITVAY